MFTGGGRVASLLLEDDAATIKGCDATGTVGVDLGTAGGLVAVSGATGGGTIVRSHAAVTVSAREGSAGGLVGVSLGLNISLSYASGQVSGALAGGLVGQMYGGSISQSFAIGGVKAAGDAGGLVGHASGSIQDSYATSGVRAGFRGSRGGFAAAIGGLIVRSSYSIGNVNVSHKDRNQGGFLGFAGGGDDLKWDYWDVDTSGTTQGYGGCRDENCAEAIQGLQTGQFLSGLPKGFNGKIWGQDPSINGGYPYLLANPPPH
jgi:hypothetical protein